MRSFCAQFDFSRADKVQSAILAFEEAIGMRLFYRHPSSPKPVFEVKEADGTRKAVIYLFAESQEVKTAKRATVDELC